MEAHRTFTMFRRRVSRAIRTILVSQAGSIATYVALTMPLVVGGAGLAVDIASWYRAKRIVQTAADAAAYAGALNLARQGLDHAPDLTSIQAAADDVAARNGVAVPVTVNRPPTSGLAAGDTASVEVIATEPAPLHFTRLFLRGAPQIAARAVAKAMVADACVWSLHPTARGALTVSGSASLELGCGVVVNSAHEEAALNQTGSSCLSATSITIRGGYSGSCVNPEPEVFTPDYGDPLGTLERPTVGACTVSSKVHITGGVAVLSPGTYCNGIQISGGEVIFEPGLYVLKGDDLKITGNATVTNLENAGGGITFYLTGSGGKYATIDVASGAEVTLTPRTVGSLTEVLFFQDPDAPSNGDNRFTGGATMNLTGVLYFPSQHVQFGGGSVADRAEVLLVASTITFTGNSHLDADYARSLLPEIYYARLVD